MGTPVITGQKALEAQDTQFLDRSELIVQNSPVRPVQLEHNVQEYSDLLNSDSLDDKADESPERAILRHARHQSPAIGHSVTDHTDNTGTGPTGSTGSTGHTGQHRSKRQHSVHRTHSVRSDADDHRSTLINRTLQQHRLELEYGSAADRSRHRSRSSWKDSGTHRATIPLRHADPGEHSPAEMLRHRRVRSRSRSYDSVPPRRHSLSPSRSRGKKKKSHKKRKHSSTSSSSRRRSSFSSSRERSKHQHIYKKKKKHTSSHSSKRDKHVKKHKRKRSPSPSSSLSFVYTPGIYADGYIVFAFPFVRSSVNMFVSSFVRSYFRHVRGICVKVLRQSFSCGVYLSNYSSESIHIWTIVTLEGWHSLHDNRPQGPCPGVGPEVKI